MRKEPDNRDTYYSGKVKGVTRPKGRSPTRWINQIIGICERPMHELTEITEDRMEAAS